MFRRVALGLCLWVLPGTVRAEAGPPQDIPLQISHRPREIFVHHCAGSPSAVIHLALSNPSERPVRVRSVRIVYLGTDRVLRSEQGGEEFFHGAGASREDRIDREGKVEWSGICLEGIPEGTDRVRFELELSGRRRASGPRFLQRLEVPVVRPPEPVDLAPPFSGLCRVSQGHSCRNNHRLGGYGADFAWDFVALDPDTGRSVREGYWVTRKNRDSVGFGRAVLAPADGRVVRVVDEIPDNEGLRQYPRRSLIEEISQPRWVLGNHLVLDLGDGRYVLVGHLKKGSARVLPGDTVRVGDPLAEIGNSGNSIEPHLHIQVMDRPDPGDPEIKGLPARLRDYVEIRSRSHEGRRDSLVRRVAAGDPPEGSVVVPASPRGRASDEDREGN